MSFSPTIITGAAITGLTSPTYTLTQDLNTGLSKSWVVTTLGGTQTGVSTHSNSNPFSIKVQKTANVKSAPVVGPNGSVKGGGYNIVKMSVLKGAVPLTGQAPQMMLADVNVRTPAGADVADKTSIAAALSLLGGFTASQIIPIYDLVITNTV